MPNASCAVGVRSTQNLMEKVSSHGTTLSEGGQRTLNLEIRRFGERFKLATVTITLNGDPHELPGPMSVTALLAHLSIDSRRVAVEHNLVVVKRGAFESTMVREGDQVEIVNFVGGG